MTIALEIVFALIFFALIMASIALHEIGHLVPAKLFGVKVTQYFVGFGKTLWSRRRGETEYGFKAFPLGGYVRLIGMYPPAKPTVPGEPQRASAVTRLADAAREAEYEFISSEDDGRLFYQKKTWQKLIVMASGPLMNVLIAFLLFWGITGLHGQYRPQMTVAEVQRCMIPADRAERTCQPGDPATPASKTGIKVGDTIVAFNGRPVDSWDEMSELIRDNMDRSVTLTVLRDGQRVELTTVNTVITGRPDKLDPSRRVSVGFLGVSPESKLVKGGPVAVAGDMWDMTAASAVALARFPVKVYNVTADLITGKPRDIYGPMSIVGASRTAGEIAVTQQLSLTDKAVVYASLLGSVNLFVALLNFVPLLPLDGGHIAGALYEGAKRRLAQLFGRPDPGHVDTARMLPVAYVVGGFLLISGLVLIVADIISPISIF